MWSFGLLLLQLLFVLLVVVVGIGNQNVVVHEGCHQDVTHLLLASVLGLLSSPEVFEGPF